jgi:hypothetical protein
LVGVGLLIALSTGTGWGNEIPQPASVTQLSYESVLFPEPPGGKGASESPGNAAMNAPAPDAGYDGCCNPCGCCDPCGTGCGSRCGYGCLGDPWTLPQPCFLQCMGIKVGGWLQQGITMNADGVDFNGPVATNDWDHEYQMNQLWLYLDRPADTGGSGWALGGHFDILLGTDWRFGINHGLEDRINGFHRQSYGTVIPQMYLEVAVDNLSVKVGHFAGILDYEVVPGPPNPFYSHSYCYGYTVPQLVTGVLADYKLSDRLSIQGGFHRGWMMFEDYNDDLDVMAGVKWTSYDKRTSIAYAISNGAQDPAGHQNRFVYSLVAKRKLTQRLEYVAVHNLGVEDDGAPNGNDAEWYGLNNYFLYKINPCWSANVRFEWLRDDDGVRIAGPGNIPGVRAWEGAGYAGHFYELTLGMTWRPTANLMFRPEVRWDWYDGLPSPKPGHELPFNDGEEDDQVLFAVDAVVSY